LQSPKPELQPHDPFVQIMLVPQETPFALFATLAVHWDWPVAQEVVPVVQTVGLHATPAVHELHVPW
jgi:hypothetical protein